MRAHDTHSCVMLHLCVHVIVVVVVTAAAAAAAAASSSWVACAYTTCGVELEGVDRWMLLLPTCDCACGRACWRTRHHHNGPLAFLNMVCFVLFGFSQLARSHLTSGMNMPRTPARAYKGMSAAFLSDLVCGIGESKKKAVPWLNGQFGFGVHAFRAAAARLVVYSKQAGGPLYTLALERDQIEGIPRPAILDDAGIAKDKSIKRARTSGLFGTFYSNNNSGGNGVGEQGQGQEGVILGTGSVSGTSVLIEGFDKVWFDSITAESLSAEIERHFESLLGRDGLEVVVSEKGKKNKRVACLPFDYASLEGKHINETICVRAGGADEAPLQLECKMIVSKTMIPGKKARFFKMGRSIASVADTRSFMAVSQSKASLWDHPSLCGYIEVGASLEPAITRDEFIKTANRSAVYDALLPLEEKLQAALDEVRVAQADEKFAELESILSKVVSEVSRQDSRILKGDGDGDADDDGSDEGAHDRTPDDTEIVDGDTTYTTIKSKPVNEEAKPAAAANKTQKKPPPKPRHEIRFVRAESLADGTAKRSFAAGTCVNININHSDFMDRVEHDAKGRLKFGPRVSAYLANELAVHYRMDFYDKHNTMVPDDRLNLYGELCDSVNQVESSLTRKIGTLERNMRSAARYKKK